MCPGVWVTVTLAKPLDVCFLLGKWSREGDHLPTHLGLLRTHTEGRGMNCISLSKWAP